jgi:hypothetical protein
VFFRYGASSTKVIGDQFFSAYQAIEHAKVAGLAGKNAEGQRVRVKNISLNLEVSMNWDTAAGLRAQATSS